MTTIVLAACLLTGPLQEPARPAAIEVVVVDGSGAAVPGATVVVDAEGQAALRLVSMADGRVTVPLAQGAAVVLIVTAPGFAELRRGIADSDQNVVIVLQPAGLQETISVTATRGAVHLTSPASSSTLTTAELTNTAAAPVDDILRNSPGFGLTRRSSSRVANPSTQGVTLRGLPGNAGRRTLVLADGLPLNDPFGGWVYWNRIPEAALDRIEMVRGAAGDLYGGDAVSGVIQLFTVAPTRSLARGSIDAGSAGTTRGSFFGAGAGTRWQGAAAAEWVDTDGVPVVAERERGPVDVNATSRYSTGFLDGAYQGGSWRGRVRASAYREDRGNGTPLVMNRTGWRQLSGDVSMPAGGGTLTVQASGSSQRYYNNFSSVPPSRATERVTSEQWLPSTSQRAVGQWNRAFGGHLLLLGAEHTRTDAEVQEYRFALNGTRSGPFLTGGLETVSSFYGRAVMALGARASMVAGARADAWRSTPLDVSSPRHAVTFFSPRVSVNWQLHDHVSVRGSLARAYRTPTLDELHRSSQVGNTVTLGNVALDPERLTSVEMGVLVGGSRASFRATGFFNDLDDAITNVTLSTTPSLITRQKKNSDTLRASGLELEAEHRVRADLMISGWIVVTSSRYRNVASLPALEGHRVPQIPISQVAVALTYTNPRLAVFAMQARAAGMQYEDDLNTLELAPFRVVDVSVTRRLNRAMQAYLAIENVFDTEIQTGRTPVTKIGWPRTVRAGLRFALP